MRKKRSRYTEAELRRALVGAKYMADVCRNLGVKPVGGNYREMWRRFELFGIKTDHLNHEPANKGREFVRFEDLLKTTLLKSD